MSKELICERDCALYVEKCHWADESLCDATGEACLECFVPKEQKLSSEFDVKPSIDVANQPHYTKGSIEPKDFILANDMGFCEGNVVKYITRYKHKNGIEDLKKIKVYVDFLIADLEKDD